MENRKIFILKTAPDSLIEKLLLLCREKWKNYEIVVLGSGDIDFKGVGKITFFREKPSFGNLLKYTKKGDVIFLPYNNVRGEGYYLKYELPFSFLLGRDIYIFNIHEFVYKKGKYRLLFGLPLYYFQKKFRLIIEFIYEKILLLYFNLRKTFSLFKFNEKLENKIVFVTHFGWRLPSARVRCYGFARYLKEKGIEAEVISMEDDFGICNDGVSPTEKFIGNIKLYGVLMKKKPKVICVLKGDYHFFACLYAAFSLNSKLIFDIDDYEKNEYVFSFARRKSVEIMLSRFSAVTITASKYLEKYFSGYSKSLYYVPTGVDTEFFRCPPKNKGKSKIICGWSGMVADEGIVKNLEFLFDCLEEMDSNIVLYVAAGGVNYERARRIAKGKLGERAVFFKNIKPENMNDFVCKVDFAVIPFVEDNEYNKAKSPTKLFEFMSAGKPCIVSDIGEAKTIIENAVDGYLAGNVDEFKRYIDILAKDEKLRLEMGKKAREKIEEKYSIKKSADRFFEAVKGFF